jgi:putative Ca2+/H+ antiporter (TMEM165/GDT1 family)
LRPEVIFLDPRLFATVFASVFLAELGDKTQLATLLYASDPERSKLTVFAAAASALVLTSALGVLAGSLVGQYVSPKLVRWVAGLGFIAVGVWVLAVRE